MLSSAVKALEFIFGVIPTLGLNCRELLASEAQGLPSSSLSPTLLESFFYES